MNIKPKYKRILLKLTGESFSGKRGFGIDFDAVSEIASQIKEVKNLGVQVAVISGGGNIFRGRDFKKGQAINRATADYMGMLGTVINALALQDVLENQGITTRVQTAIEMRQIAQPYIHLKAVRHMEKGRVVILSCGTGNPYFTTDTAAALRAVELGCDVLLKATKVDGVYDSDPKLNHNAKKLKKISFNEILRKRLMVMDANAFALCQDNNLPIIVFNLFEKGNLKKVVLGENLGTIVYRENP